MFEDFANKKFNEYLNKVEFSEDTILFQKIKSSNLPPFIINFFDCSIERKKIPLERNEFEDTLRKAIIFNINYVIKPKSTLLKFLFGEVETRPAEYIQEKLMYFQFYRYYLEHIVGFINLNSPLVISAGQIENLLNKINKKIYNEINDTESTDTDRLNLIKLLYHFFIELTENNPINIKLPKKVLSAFFLDKQFLDIKKRIDVFFKDEIFIQEAVELIKKRYKETDEIDEPLEDFTEDKAVDNIIQKAKEDYLNGDVTSGKIKKTMPADEPELDLNIEIIRTEQVSPESEESSEKKIVLEEELYSSELLNIMPVPDAVNKEYIPEEDKDKKLIDELFCEVSYRNKIIKKLFRNDEKLFSEYLLKLFDIKRWETVSEFIDDYFIKNKIDYYSEAAVKFVDVMHEYFENE